MRRQTAGAASLLFFVALFRCSFFFSSLTWPPRIAVVYNASNNELERTKTLVKNAVVQVDAAPFRAWYQQHYGKKIGIKVKNGEKVESEDIEGKRSNALVKKLKERNAKHAVAANIDAQFVTGRLYALVTSRPGQCGRCDGYVLEGKELDFYLKKMQKKKSKAAAE